jgi:nickel transport protein
MAGLMRRALTTLAAVLTFSTAAQAHQLTVFAFVEDGMVIVESRFSNGKVPVSGEVRVRDIDDALLQTLPLRADGTATFPLDPEAAANGLMIEVETGEGHDSYWILTPADIAAEPEE